MTDKEKIAEIKKQVKIWQDILLLQQWNIRLFFHKKKDRNDKDNMAHVTRKLEYRFSRIHFFLPNIKKKTLEDTVIHELVHLVLGDYDWLLEKSILFMKPAISKVCEGTTTHVTKIIANIAKINK